MLILRKQTEQQGGAVPQVTPDPRLTPPPAAGATHHPPGPRRHVVTKLPLDGPRRRRHGRAPGRTSNASSKAQLHAEPTEVALGNNALWEGGGDQLPSDVNLIVVITQAMTCGPPQAPPPARPPPPTDSQKVAAERGNLKLRQLFH